MSAKTKAVAKTAKSVGLGLAIGVVFYFLMKVLGPQLGLILLLVSMVGWFTWLTYDYYVHKFTVEEKLNN